MKAFKSARCAKRDGGIEGADGDTDLGVGGGGAALGGSDVRAALQQLRWYAEGNLGQREIERRGRNAELR